MSKDIVLGDSDEEAWWVSKQMAEKLEAARQKDAPFVLEEWVQKVKELRASWTKMSPRERAAVCSELSAVREQKRRS